MRATIVLFHQNLRLADNRALAWGAARGPIVPLYIHDVANANPYPAGGASRWWLQEALKDLSAGMKQKGTRLILRRGAALDILREIIQATGAQAVTWQRRYEPFLQIEDNILQAKLNSAGIETKIHDGFLLFNPDIIRTGANTPFKVFTPFSRACLSSPPPPPPVPAPGTLVGIPGVASEDLEDWRLAPRASKWPQGLAAAWRVGESAAHEQLHDFIETALTRYKTERDRPDQNGTSRLSPYLHFGQISPHQIWEVLHKADIRTGIHSGSTERYLLEILWREFSWHLLHQFPGLPEKPLAPSFSTFPWRPDKAGLAAWKKGRTGYPIVDAGMRQLWQTGWMHNRVRMIAASFLVKDLLIDWREGAAWFWDTLVDADLGSNSASWQWVAGCGADAAPFFRIFNPILQGKKFDPDGNYVRRYVPELAALDPHWIHTPWQAPAEILRKAGIVPGTTYPLPVVDHDHARKRALAALAGLKDSGSKKPPSRDLFD